MCLAARIPWCLAVALGLVHPITAQTVPGEPVLDPRITQPVRPGTVQPRPISPRQLNPQLQLAGAPPQFVRATVIGARSVSLTWSPPAGNGATGYWIHQADTSGRYYRQATLVTDTTTSVNHLLPGTSYRFKVSATYPAESQRGEAFSDAVAATTGPAPAPSNLAASAGQKGVSLTWDKLSGADGFRLYRNGAVLAELKPTQLSLDSPAVLRTWYDDPAGPGTYQYQIQAVYLAPGAEADSPLTPAPALTVTVKSP